VSGNGSKAKRRGRKPIPSENSAGGRREKQNLLKLINSEREEKNISSHYLQRESKLTSRCEKIGRALQRNFKGREWSGRGGKDVKKRCRSGGDWSLGWV